MSDPKTREAAGAHNEIVVTDQRDLRLRDFIAGAEYMRDRILGMLRSKKAEIDADEFCYEQDMHWAADWIEKELKK